MSRSWCVESWVDELYLNPSPSQVCAVLTVSCFVKRLVSGLSFVAAEISEVDLGGCMEYLCMGFFWGGTEFGFRPLRAD